MLIPKRQPRMSLSNTILDILRNLLPDAEQRDQLLAAAHAEGIHLRPFWTPLHRQPMYRDAPRMDLPNTEALFARGVCLPSSAALGGGA